MIRSTVHRATSWPWPRSLIHFLREPHTRTAILADWTELRLFVREYMQIMVDMYGVNIGLNQVTFRAESRVDNPADQSDGSV